jgi:hypothetical protein
MTLPFNNYGGTLNSAVYPLLYIIGHEEYFGKQNSNHYALYVICRPRGKAEKNDVHIS